MHKQELVIVQDGDEFGTHSFVVKDIGGRYEADSVLAGQVKISFVDAFDTLEEAKAAYPEAQVTHPHLLPQNTFDHLPDEQDIY
ncbi:hypothetical protein [Alteromonas macleodii]|uniref:hypothetical protein n=1 Tax=Alteromonas macleodii TaxID=28108 RepID=UPI00313FF0FA